MNDLPNLTSKEVDTDSDSSSPSLLVVLVLLLLLLGLLLLLHDLLLLMSVLDLHLLNDGFPMLEKGDDFVERERLHRGFVLAHRHGHIVYETFHSWHCFYHLFKLADCVE